eukprot:Rmarinus@m.28780
MLYLWRREMMHPIVYAAVLAAAWFLISRLLSVIHWSVFTYDGQGFPGVELAAGVFETLGELTMMTLLFFVAYGWGISTSHLSEIRYFLLLVSGLIISHVMLFIHEHVHRDRADFRYIYATDAGVAIITIRLLMSLFFCVCVVMKPLRHERDAAKRAFYVRFLVAYIVWFSGVPLSALVAVVVDPWVRDIVVEVFRSSFDLFAFILLMFLFRPGHGLKVFTPRELAPKRLRFLDDHRVAPVTPQVQRFQHDWAADGFQEFQHRVAP